MESLEAGQWIKNFQSLKNGPRPTMWRALIRLTEGLCSRLGDGGEGAIGPYFLTVEASELEEVQNSKIEKVQRVISENDTAFADVYLDAGNNEIVLNIDENIFADVNASKLGQDLAEAFRIFFGSCAWASWVSGRNEGPRFRSVHIPLNPPDAMEGSRLLGALKDAERKRGLDEMKKILAQIADAISDRLPAYRRAGGLYSTNLRCVSESSPGLWEISFGSGTGGQRLFYNSNDRTLYFPSQGVGLSWDFQDGFKRLFGDCASFDKEDAIGRMVYISSWIKNN